MLGVEFDILFESDVREWSLSSFLCEIAEMTDAEDVWDALYMYAQKCGFRHMAYGIQTPGNPDNTSVAYHSTHHEWLEGYLSKGQPSNCYFSIRGLTECAPFIGGLEYLPEPWASDENYREVSQFAYDHGFKRTLAIPLTLDKVRMGANGIAFHTDVPKEEFEANVTRYQNDLTIASMYANEWLRPHFMGKLAKVNAPALSRRQREVLNLFLQGVPNKEIAFQLDISPPTVSFHLKEIMMRLGAHSAREITSKAILLGLISADEIAAAQEYSHAN